MTMTPIRPRLVEVFRAPQKRGGNGTITEVGAIPRDKTVRSTDHKNSKIGVRSPLTSRVILRVRHSHSSDRSTSLARAPIKRAR